MEVLETFTVDSPIPYDINSLLDGLNKDNIGTKTGASGKEVKGDWNGRLTRFIGRLKAKIGDRCCGFMLQPPKECNAYDWLEEMLMKLFSVSESQRGIKIIDFSEVPSDVLPIITGVLARLLHNIQFWMDRDTRHPLTVACDGAHLYLSVRDTAEATEKRVLEVFKCVAKEGEKYGVSLLIASQHPSDVGRITLNQCSDSLVLRLTSDQSQSVMEWLLSESMAGITDILSLPNLGGALLLGDSILLPTGIKLDEPTITPESATRQFWGDWANQEPRLDAIPRVVEALRRQIQA